MPLPRITGLLHNCALNTALPILLDGIRQLAEHEAAGTLDALSLHVIFQHYQRLKKIFARHYLGNAHSSLNWRQFQEFIGSHSFYANELLFAPVFRAYIAEVGLASGSYRQVDVGLLRDVEHDGSYSLLPITEAIDLFHNSFGISVETYEFEEHRGTTNPKDNYRFAQSKLTTNRDYPFGATPSIELYLKGMHFEVQPHESLADANRQYVAEINGLPRGLKQIHDGLSTSQYASTTNRYLEQLTAYGRGALLQQISRSESLPDEPKVRLCTVAGQTIEVAGQLHKETKDDALLNVIEQTKTLVKAPTSQNIHSYHELYQTVERNKANWGKILAGLMLTLIGVALIIAAVAVTAVTLGAAAPIAPIMVVAGVGGVVVGAGSITAGACFFSMAKNKARDDEEHSVLEALSAPC